MVITKVYQLFADPARWTQGTMARQDNNYPCCPHSKLAVCWCLYGGMMKIYPNHKERMFVRKKIVSKIKDSPTRFNDISTHQEVFQLCKELNI